MSARETGGRGGGVETEMGGGGGSKDRVEGQRGGGGVVNSEPALPSFLTR